MKLIKLFVLALFIVFAFLVTGCSVFLPAKPKFPEAIPELTKPCPDLKKIEGDKVAITDLLRTVVDNYALYYDCSLKNDSWNDWYNKQKDIYNKIK